MATSSYANLFGTTGSGKQQGVGFGNLFGQQEAPKAQAMQQPPATQPTAQPAPTFAQMQQQGQARPAAPAPTAPAQPPMLQQVQQQLAQPAAMKQAPPTPGVTELGPDSIITTTAAPGQINPWTGKIQPTPVAPVTVGSQAYDTLQQQIQAILGQPIGYSSEQLAQMRQTAVSGLERQFGAQRSALEEELARRGLAASSIGAGRFGDLGGQQAQALAGLEANLLQQQMEAQERGRGQQLTALTALAGQRADIDTRAAQLQQEALLQGRSMDIQEARMRAEMEQADLDRALRERLGMAEFTGTIGGQETLQSRTQRQNLAIQLAQALAGSDDPEAIKSIMPYIYQIFGITPSSTTPTAPIAPITPITPITPAAPTTPIAPIAPIPPLGPVSNVPTQIPAEIVLERRMDDYFPELF